MTWPRLDDVTNAMREDQRARDLVEHARALLLGGGPLDARLILESRIGEARAEVFKSASTPLSSQTAPALAPAATSPFLELTRRRALLGQLAGTLPAPLNTPIPIVTTDPVAGWGTPLPASMLALTSETLNACFVGCVLGFSRELVRSTDSRAISLLERLLQNAVVVLENSTLLDDQAAAAFVRPAGLLFGLSPVASTSPPALDDDLVALWAAVRGGDPSRPHFITSARGAVYLASLNSDGAPVFPAVSPVVGGRIWGVPQLVAKEAGNKLVLVDAASLAVSDLGLALDASDVATIELDTAPAIGASAVLTSGWQSNIAFLRIVRYLNWVLGHADAVGFIELPIAP